MTVIEVRHGRHHRGFGFPTVDLSVLELEVAQPVIARVNASVSLDYPHRMEVVLHTAAVAVAAKLRPRNGFAEATL